MTRKHVEAGPVARLRQLLALLDAAAALRPVRIEGALFANYAD